jgi:hypothetical protein
MVMILVRDKIRDNIYCPTESSISVADERQDSDLDHVYKSSCMCKSLIITHTSDPTTHNEDMTYSPTAFAECVYV